MKALVKNELRQTKGMLAIWLSLELMLIAFAYFEYLSLEGSLEELTHAAALSRLFENHVRGWRQHRFTNRMVQLHLLLDRLAGIPLCRLFGKQLHD